MIKSLIELKTPVDLAECTRIAHDIFICKVFQRNENKTFDLSQELTFQTVLEEAAVWKLFLYRKLPVLG